MRKLVRTIARWSARTCAGCALLFAVQGHAFSLDEQGRVSLNVFGTLGAVYNSDENVEFVRDYIQPDGPKGEWSLEPDTVLGAQLSVRPSPEWEAVLQVISRHNTNGGYDPRLTWAYLKYSPDPAFQLRLGRLGWDAFMRADSRNVGYSYLTARPPIEYYGTLAQTHIDGADAVFKHRWGEGVLSLKLFAGLANEEGLTGTEEHFDLAGSEIFGGYLDWQWRDWQWRLGASRLRFDKETPALEPLQAFARASGSPQLTALVDAIALKGSRLDNWNLGVVYDRGPLQAQLLYNRRQIESIGLSDNDSWFGLLGYRIGRATPYVGHVRSDGDFSPDKFSLLPAPLDRALATARMSEQQNWLAGLRYDVTANAAVKFQVERIKATKPLGGLFLADPDWDGDTTVVTIALDFIF